MLKHNAEDQANSYITKPLKTFIPLPVPKLSSLQARIVLFAVSVLCFAASWDGEFVFDDSEAIINNKDLDSSQPLSDLLIHDFWGKKLTNTSHKSYRPLTVLTFRWSHWLAGGLHSKGFHIANIILHGVISVLLLDLFHLILYGAGMSSGCQVQNSSDGLKNGHYSLNSSSSRSTIGSHPGSKSCGAGSDLETAVAADPLSLMCSLLFAVHPVHTESVAGIVGRADLLCALFFILSFLTYVKGSTCDQPTRPTSCSFQYLTLSMLLCGLATFSKEQGITVIGVCCAYDVMSICQVDLGELFGLRKSSSGVHVSSLSQATTLSSTSSSPGNGSSFKNKNNSSSSSSWVSCLAKRLTFLAISAVVLLVMRWRIMGSAPPTFQVHDNPHSFVNGSLYRAINYNYLYAINAWILLSPHWLCFDWSMGCVPTITTLTDPRIVPVLALWGATGMLAWACLRGLHRETARPVSLGVVLLVVPFLPASNLLFRVGFVVAERVLYLPSVGFCVLVCLGVRALCQWRPVLKEKVMVCFLLLIVLLCARCVQRSLHWQSEMSLFMAGEKVCPLNAKVHYNIGKLNGDQGNSEESIARYRLAIELNPVYDQAMNNLANILKDQGDLLEAETLLDKAVKINPIFSSGWMNRGITKAALGKYQDSEDSYWKAINIRRKYPDCYYNLGNMLLETKRHQEALQAFRNATNLKPTHWNSWNNAVILLDNLGHHEQAIKLGLEAIKHLPDHPSILYSLGNAYGKIDDYPNSERMFLRAVSVDPKNAALYQNLGVLYHRWSKYSKALEYYQKAYQMNPKAPSLVDNMNMLKRLMNKGH